MKLFHLIFYLQWQEQFASAFFVCLLFSLIKFPIQEKISIFATVVAMLCSCAKSNLNELPDVSSGTGLYIEIDDCHVHNVCGVMNPYAYTFIDRCG
jgi:hypothetical protein